MHLILICFCFIFSNNENDLNSILAQNLNLSPNVKNYLSKTEDIFYDYSMDSSVIYESIENNECEEINVISNNTKNANEFCANNCELIIKRLRLKSERLNKEVIDLEEQNVELIKDKHILDSDLNAIKESFDKKLSLKNKDIEELTNSLFIFESLNSSLEKKLEQKFEEKVKLELYIKQIEDKV